MFVCLFVLFRLIESVTVYICLAVICLVCIPTGCCVIGVNAHLLRHFRPFTDNILVYLWRFLALCIPHLNTTVVNIHFLRVC